MSMSFSDSELNSIIDQFRGYMSLTKWTLPTDFVDTGNSIIGELPLSGQSFTRVASLIDDSMPTEVGVRREKTVGYWEWQLYNLTGAPDDLGRIKVVDSGLDSLALSIHMPHLKSVEHMAQVRFALVLVLMRMLPIWRLQSELLMKEKAKLAKLEAEILAEETKLAALDVTPVDAIDELPPSRKRALARTQRKMLVAKLRKDGWSIPDIAERVDKSEETVERDLGIRK